MNDGPDISRVASLIGDPARSQILLALMDGRAFTPSELANIANITKQTTSSHLARLLDGGLVRREIQGRHHYYRLSGPDIAHVIETLLHVSERGIGKRTRTGPRDPALRKARICYDHLAGELGVELFDTFTARGWLIETESAINLTQAGWAKLNQLSIHKNDLPKTRRPHCRTCLDWSMRRHHLAGQVGAALLTKFFEHGWAVRRANSRIIDFTDLGFANFQAWLHGQSA